MKGASTPVIGKAQINEIGHLAPEIPINGFYSVFASKSADKIAELHASLVFEPLPAAYDSSGSIPTTDLSVATAGTGTAESSSTQSQSARGAPPLPVPRSHRLMSSSSDDPFMSPIPKMQYNRHVDVNCERDITTPRGIDSDYSFVIGPGRDQGTEKKTKQKSHIIAETGHEREPVARVTRRGQSSDTEYRKTTPSDVETLLGSNQDQSVPEIPVPSRLRHPRLNPSSQPGSDLISALLDRGTRLRDDMIRSELERGKPTVKGAQDRVLPLDVDVEESRIPKRPSSGELFRELLKNDETQGHVTAAPARDRDTRFEDSNTEGRTVELLIGDHITMQELNDLRTLQSEMSPQSSVSSESELLSETEDPLRDQSILEELFYKGGRSSSNSSLSDLLSSDDEEEGKTISKTSRMRRRRRSYESSLSDPGNQRPPSTTIKSTQETSRVPEGKPSNEQKDSRHEPERPKRRASSLRRQSSSGDSDAGSTSRLSSEGSRVSFDVPHHHVDKRVSPGDGLSVQRLTLLGRVHVARVIIDSLCLKAAYIPGMEAAHDRRPSRGGRGRGRPPRPSLKPKPKRCTYFVEYHFPVTASPRGQNLVNTMATEVMRLVSKKVDSNGEVTFGHRSVFPIRFDGTAVDSWWKQLLVFKVFSRIAGQKKPTLLGVASVPLRSVLQSSDLSILDVDLDVKDKSQPSSSSKMGQESSIDGHSPSDTIIGDLKVSIELASDAKDFPMALARMKVAEMKGATIVPLPSNRPHLPIKIPTGSTESDSRSSSRSVQTESVRSQKVTDGLPTTARNHTEGGHSLDGNSQEESIVHPQRKDEGLKEQPSRQRNREERITIRQQNESAQVSQSKTEYEVQTLHSLLLIPEGRGVTIHGVAPPKSSSHIPHTPPKPHPGWGVAVPGLGAGRDLTVRNTYLVCRLFWSDDSVRSNVCWGTTEPNYNFMQVYPVLLTPSLLERARNNFMMIEVWDKKTSAENDQLVGIAKLPLHQFYMSFRDERIASTLLKSQYPVVAVDNYVNIIDPFTGTQFGQLKVLLAMGSSEQISAVQRLKCDIDIADSRPMRPGHYLERGEAVSRNVDEQEPSSDELVEHVFEVIVEGVRGLPQLENTVWGEADCFVQYHFPSQAQHRASAGVAVTSVGPVLTPHQTPTTLCMPDPTFHDVSRHRLQLPRGTPVQRELLTACAGVGGGAGGIPFEVWFRYYYPNIRDQVIAKSTLPLAKLCAMVTMQRRGEPSVQTFSLPLRLQHPDQDSLTKEQIAKLQDAGLIDVTINYRHCVVQGQGSAPAVREMGGPQVCLSVGVIRACGLKSAAKSLAKFDSGLQYASEVGVNAYIKMELSFLSKQDVRVTQTIARSFAPEFSHHVDFPCPLLFDEQESESLSLAEALESAEMILQVWHQVPGFRSENVAKVIPVAEGQHQGISAQRRFAPTGDVLLGTTTVPLHSLLAHRTGIQGWYPLTTPTPGWGKQPAQPPSHFTSETPKSLGRSGLERVGGGLELSIKFPLQGDRDRVMEAGRRVGWSPDVDHEGLEEMVEEEGGAAGSRSANISINIDSAWFPVHAALRPGQNALDSAAKAYVRYKFYDKGSVCSKLCYVDVNDKNYIQADFKHSHHFHAAFSQPLAWYLREERLELQLWVSFNQELSAEETSHTRPRQRDKLIGCAYVDMSALCDKRIKQHRISGLYPLFRPGSTDLGGSCMRVHLNLKHLHGGMTHQQEWSEEDEHLPSSSHRTRPPPSRPSHQEVVMDPEEAARRIEEERRRQQEEDERRKMMEPVLMGVAVERAMHLPSVPGVNRLDDSLPSCYVTFQQADGAPVHTDTVPDNDQPVWGSEHEVRISAEVLDRQSFIFKVWHQAGSERDMNSDRMLGFASVDLAPLLSGFRSLNGWYNILDFSGHCQGQIKVSIIPRESVSPLKRSPKQKTTPNTSAIFAQGFPLVPFSTFAHQHQPSKQVPKESSKPTGQQPPPPKSTHPPQSLNHYTEHLQNVRKFHEDLHSKLKVQQQGWTTAEKRGDTGRGSREVSSVGFEDRSQGPTAVSSSFLMTNLRKNLEELDSMNQGLQQRLTVKEPRESSQDKEQMARPVPPAPQEPLRKGGGHQSVDANRQPENISYMRTSDEDILEKVRQDLRQEGSIEDEDGHNADWYGQDIDGRCQDIDGRGQDTDRLGYDENIPGHNDDGHGHKLGRGHDEDGYSQYENGRGHGEFRQGLDEDGHSQDENGGGPDEDARVPLYESDWEDDMQFRDEDDVIVPKPLNDVSSPYFSNAVRPDAFRADLTLDPSRELHYELRETETDSERRKEVQEEEDFRTLETEKRRTVMEHSEGPHHDSSAQEAHEEYLEDQDLRSQAWQSDAAESLPTNSNESERLAAAAAVKYQSSDGDRDSDSNNGINQEISADDIDDHVMRAQRNGDDHHRHYTSAMNDAVNKPEDWHAARTGSEPHRASSADTKTGEEFADAPTLTQDAAGPEDESFQDMDANQWIAQGNECHTGVNTADKYTRIAQGKVTQVKGHSQVDPDDRLGSEKGGFSEHQGGASVHGRLDEDGRGGVVRTDEESVAFTSGNERQVVQETRRKGLPDKPQPAPVQMPNFFLPAHDLEASMRALHTVTSILPRSQPRPVHSDQMSESRPTDAARDLTQRLASKRLSGRAVSARPTLKHSHKLPTAEEAKRIAKIFASRLTES
ncbi:C2 domain-containing protein 3-like isoform X1 [Asterias amurensis]|uniref:C2 domain-containing protein 3-like isoform X1 n=1 Tax=Asterias amurensis TaxID=7602 RepID=UPI003AB62B1F